jgi:CBS-domain-containing membrane protein
MYKYAYIVHIMKRQKVNIQDFRRFMGLDANQTGHLEKLLSGLGGLLSILAITLISQQMLGAQDAVLVVASMGATAVLLFAVPHGPLSQPWPLLGGHVISAIIGVGCALLVPSQLLAAAVAVALAIAVMHYLRCIHPPGGATALTAVIGGESIQALGFQYVLTPVLLNAVVMLFIAIGFNYAFHWRRYPAALAASVPGKQAKFAADKQQQITQQELESALNAMGSTVDINGRELADIVELAQQKQNQAALKPQQLRIGSYYSNGQYGRDWQVRQIIDMPDPMNRASDLLIYKIVAGANRRKTGTASFEDFAFWASNEVFQNETSWVRSKLNREDCVEN